MFVKVIDDNGREIGCIERSYLVKFGLKHQIARVIVFSEKDHAVLLQQGSFSKDSCPGMWDTSSSGHVDAHEIGETAALRELNEEIGVKATPKSIAFVGSFDTSDKLPGGMLSRETLIYCLQVRSNNKIYFRVDPVELETIDWVNIKDLDKKDLTPGAITSLDIFKQWLQKSKIYN